MPPPSSRFLFKERLEPGAGVSRRTRLRRLLFTNGEEIAKIPSFFVDDWIRVGFAAGIGVMGVVEGAVQAAMQVNPAARTGITPADAVCANNRVLATNEIGEENRTSAAVSDGKIFLRGNRNLYCIGVK